MDSRSLICWYIPPLTTKVGLNSLQYLINLHMGHYVPNSKLCRMSHTPPSKEPTSSSAQHTHNWANDDQECSPVAHMTVRPMPAHVPCRAPIGPTRAMNPMSAHQTRTRLWPQRLALIPFCNAPESKLLRPTLHVERTTPTTT